MQNDPTLHQASDAEVKKAVKDRYAGLARSDVSQREGTRLIAQAFGYDDQQLASIPADANLGVSCGNPTAMASLQPGEVVLDLGSGAGLDVFLAAQKVGPTGRAIGVDMTEDMIQRARRNAEQAGFTNVEFHLAEMESMPLEDNSVDCAISNCVINLVPDKAKAFAEIYRVLKPGGRLAISDIALKQPLPQELVENFSAYIGCLAGAISIDEYRYQLSSAGFEMVEIVDKGADLSVYAKLAEATDGCGQTSCCQPASEDAPLHKQFTELLQKYDVNQFAASVNVFALKAKD